MRYLLSVLLICFVIPGVTQLTTVYGSENNHSSNDILFSSGHVCGSNCNKEIFYTTQKSLSQEFNKKNITEIQEQFNECSGVAQLSSAVGNVLQAAGVSDSLINEFKLPFERLGALSQGVDNSMNQVFHVVGNWGQQNDTIFMTYGQLMVTKDVTIQNQSNATVQLNAGEYITYIVGFKRDAGEKDKGIYHVVKTKYVPDAHLIASSGHEYLICSDENYGEFFKANKTEEGFGGLTGISFDSYTDADGKVDYVEYVKDISSIIDNMFTTVRPVNDDNYQEAIGFGDNDEAYEAVLEYISPLYKVEDSSDSLYIRLKRVPIFLGYGNPGRSSEDSGTVIKNGYDMFFNQAPAQNNHNLDRYDIPEAMFTINPGSVQNPKLESIMSAFEPVEASTEFMKGLSPVLGNMLVAIIRYNAEYVQDNNGSTFEQATEAFFSEWGASSDSIAYAIAKTYLNALDAEQGKTLISGIANYTGAVVQVSSPIEGILVAMQTNLLNLYNSIKMDVVIEYNGNKYYYGGLSDTGNSLFGEMSSLKSLWLYLDSYERNYLSLLYKVRLNEINKKVNTESLFDGSTTNQMNIFKSTQSVNGNIDIGSISIKHDGLETNDLSKVASELVANCSATGVLNHRVQTTFFAKELVAVAFAEAVTGREVNSLGLSAIIDIVYAHGKQECAMFTDIPKVGALYTNAGSEFLSTIAHSNQSKFMSLIKILYDIQHGFEIIASDEYGAQYGYTPEQISEMVGQLSASPNEETFAVDEGTLLDMIRGIIGLHDIMELLKIDAKEWSSVIEQYYNLYPLIEQYRDNPLIAKGYDNTPSYEEPLAKFFSVSDKSVSEDWKRGFALSALFVPMETSLYDSSTFTYLDDSEWLSDFYYKYGFYRKAVYISTDNAAVVNEYMSGTTSTKRIATFRDLLEYNRDIILYVDDNFYNADSVKDAQNKLDYTSIRDSQTKTDEETDDSALSSFVENTLANIFDVDPDQILKTNDAQYYSYQIAKNCSKFGESGDLSSAIYDGWLLNQESILDSIDDSEYSPKQSFAVVSAIYKCNELYNYMTKAIAGDNAIFKSSRGIANMSTNPDYYLTYMNYLMLTQLENAMRNDVSATLDLDAPIFCDMFGNIITESGLVIIPAASNATLAGKNWSPATIGFATFYKESGGFKLSDDISEDFREWFAGYRIGLKEVEAEYGALLKNGYSISNVSVIESVTTPDGNPTTVQWLLNYSGKANEGWTAKVIDNYYIILDEDGKMVTDLLPIVQGCNFVLKPGYTIATDPLGKVCNELADAYEEGVKKEGYIAEEMIESDKYQNHEKGSGWFTLAPDGKYRLEIAAVSSGNLSCTIQWETLSRNSNLIKQVFYDKAYKDIAENIFGNRITNLIVEVLRGAPIENIKYEQEGIVTSASLDKQFILVAYALENILDMTESTGADISNNIVSMIDLNFLDGVEYIMLYVYKIVFAALIVWLMIQIYTESVKNRMGISAMLAFAVTCVTVVASVYFMPSVASWSYYQVNKQLLQEEAGYIALLNYVKNMEGSEIGITSVTTPESTTELYMKLDNVNVPWWEITGDVLFGSTYKTLDEMYEDYLNDSLISQQPDVIRKANGLYISLDDILDSTYIQYSPNIGMLKTRNSHKSGSVFSYASPYYVILEQLIANINVYNGNNNIQSYSQKVSESGHVITYDITAPYFKSAEFLEEGYDITGLHQILKTNSSTIKLSNPFSDYTGTADDSSDVGKMMQSLWWPTLNDMNLNRELVNQVEDYARNWIVTNKDMLGKVPDEAFLKIFALQIACKYNEVFNIPACKNIEIINVDSKDLVRFLFGDRVDIYRNYSYSLPRYVYTTSGVLGCIACAIFMLFTWIASILKPILMLGMFALLIFNIIFRKILFKKDSQCAEGYILSCTALMCINGAYGVMLKVSMSIMSFGLPVLLASLIAMVVQIGYVLCLTMIIHTSVRDWRNNGKHGIEMMYQNIMHGMNMTANNMRNSFMHNFNSRYRNTMPHNSFVNGWNRGENGYQRDISVDSMEYNARNRLKRGMDRPF